jgi:hypothetical protein
MVYAQSHIIINTLLSERIIFGFNEYYKATSAGYLESETLLSYNNLYAVATNKNYKWANDVRSLLI